jgi:DNA-binding HxlR family transcriptional regulator
MREMSDETELLAFCPYYHHAVELIGRRWTGAILRALLAGFDRFGAVSAIVPGLSDRMLSERLRELEAEGIIERIVRAEKPVRIEYVLTEKGRALGAVVEAVSGWAEAWADHRETIEQDFPESTRVVPGLHPKRH